MHDVSCALSLRLRALGLVIAFAEKYDKQCLAVARESNLLFCQLLNLRVFQLSSHTAFLAMATERGKNALVSVVLVSFTVGVATGWLMNSFARKVRRTSLPGPVFVRWYAPLPTRGHAWRRSSSRGARISRTRPTCERYGALRRPVALLAIQHNCTLRRQNSSLSQPMSHSGYDFGRLYTLAHAMHQSFSHLTPNRSAAHAHRGIRKQSPVQLCSVAAACTVIGAMTLRSDSVSPCMVTCVLRCISNESGYSGLCDQPSGRPAGPFRAVSLSHVR